MRAHEILCESATQVKESPGSQINTQTLSELVKLVASGGEVSGNQVVANLRASPSVAWAESDGKIVGLVALKIPSSTYRDKVFSNAGVPELARRYKIERGYAYVIPEYRSAGIATQLRAKLKNAGPMYVTTREQNTIVNQSLVNSGFRQSGSPWLSSRGDYKLLLWVK